MRIGVLCYPTYGGSGVVASELGKAMAARGHQVHFVNYQLPVRLRDSGYQENIFFHEVPVPNYPPFVYPPWTVALTGRLVQIVKEHRLDIIHAHYAVPHALVAVMAREIAGSVKVVATLHGTDVTLVGLEPVFTAVTRYAIRASDAVTAVSTALAQETRAVLDLDTEIHTIYNFVDLDYYRRRPYSPWARYARDGEAVLVHISNFRPVKRLDDVVKVFARVARHRAAVLLLVGDGPQRCQALSLARELGVGDRVHFLGQQQQIVSLLSAADLLLLPSEKESFGLAALEAMACGVPVVASKVGGLPEVVAAGGILCPVGDVEAMARAAEQILDQLPTWRQRARDQAGKFASRCWVDRYQQLYRQVLDND